MVVWQQHQVTTVYFSGSELVIIKFSRTYSQPSFSVRGLYFSASIKRSSPNFGNVGPAYCCCATHPAYGWAIGKLMATRKQIKVVSVYIQVCCSYCFAREMRSCAPVHTMHGREFYDSLPETGRASVWQSLLAIKKQASVKYCQLICETTPSSTGLPSIALRAQGAHVSGAVRRNEPDNL